MSKLRFKYQRADGQWAGIPYRTDVTTDDVQTTGKTGSTSTSIWDSIKGEINGWANTTFSGISNIVAAKNPATVEDNTPKVLAIAGVGVAAVILIIVLILALKK